MKTSLKALTLAALCAGGLISISFTGGCAATPTKESTGEFVDDATITTKVKAELVKDDSVKARDVTVETFKGVVQLSGFVDNADQKRHAAQIASGVPGVKEVRNNIALKGQ